MKLYHRTPHYELILRDGFLDAEGHYMTNNVYSGVWFSNVPLDANDMGHDGADYLTLEVETGTDEIDDWEWVEDGKLYREWLIPALVANRWPRQVSVEPGEE